MKFEVRPITMVLRKLYYSLLQRRKQGQSDEAACRRAYKQPESGMGLQILVFVSW